MYAMILVGGRGERLRPFTDTEPKTMTPLLNRPILYWQLKWLKAGGIKDIILLVGYQWRIIRKYFDI